MSEEYEDAPTDAEVWLKIFFGLVDRSAIGAPDGDEDHDRELAERLGIAADICLEQYQERSFVEEEENDED